MRETILVEVSGKFGPKANGKWYGVKRPLKPTDFVNGESYDVELEAWETTNGKSGVNIVSFKKADNQLVPEASKPRQKEVGVVSTFNASKSVPSYEESKNRRILVQGITQAVAASPSLASLPGTTVNEVVANIKDAALQLIEFVDEQSS